MPKDWFDITIRGGADGHFDTRQYLFPIGSAGADRFQGAYQHETISDIEMNVDIIGRVTRRLTKDLNATAIVGYNVNDRKRTNLYGQSTIFLVNTNLRNFINATTTSANNSTLNTGSNRGYTTWSFDYIFDNRKCRRDFESNRHFILNEGNKIHLPNRCFFTNAAPLQRGASGYIQRT